MSDPYYDLYIKVANGIRMLPIEVQNANFRVLDRVMDSGPKPAMRAMDQIMPEQEGGFAALIEAYNMLFSAGYKRPYELMTKESFSAYMRVMIALDTTSGDIIYPDGKSSLVLLFTLDAEGREQVEALLKDRRIYDKELVLQLLAESRGLPSAMGSGVL